MKNPKWHRDEIILALDLYSRMEPGKMNKSHPEIIELSEILNRLPIHDVRPDEAVGTRRVGPVPHRGLPAGEIVAPVVL